MNDQELYQRIYDEEEWYGDADQDRCPGVRLIPEYQHYLKSPIVDLGAGRGHTMRELRKLGYTGDSYDMVKTTAGVIYADITKPMTFTAETVLCMDVIEHILDEPLAGLWENLKRGNRQVFSIHNGESKYRGKGAKAGQDLHVNKKSFTQWDAIIRGHGFEIVERREIHKYQMLYLTRLDR